MQNFSQMRGGGLQAAFGPVATIGALGGAVFVGPSMYPALEPLVWHALSSQYDYQTASWLSKAMQISSYPATYVILRLAILAALQTASVWAVRRLF
ncbi:hypothetical protein ABMC89_13465 [Sulfitobacter sp. HNIBRBA3233]|uniref:hypothetical protein n=1 Tax=Sulfitobacter marinivivus TaxID=3158558 RepID=UPI0032DEC270